MSQSTVPYGGFAVPELRFGCTSNALETGLVVVAWLKNRFRGRTGDEDSWAVNRDTECSAVSELSFGCTSS
jgi:hypothetical protein